MFVFKVHVSLSLFVCKALRSLRLCLRYVCLDVLFVIKVRMSSWFFVCLFVFKIRTSLELFVFKVCNYVFSFIWLVVFKERMYSCLFLVCI